MRNENRNNDDRYTEDTGAYQKIAGDVTKDDEKNSFCIDTSVTKIASVDNFQILATKEALDFLPTLSMTADDIKLGLEGIVPALRQLRLLNLSGATILIDASNKTPAGLPVDSVTGFCVLIPYKIKMHIEPIADSADWFLIGAHLIFHELVHACGLDGSHPLVERLTDSIMHRIFGGKRL